MNTKIRNLIVFNRKNTCFCGFLLKNKKQSQAKKHKKRKNENNQAKSQAIFNI